MADDTSVREAGARIAQLGLTDDVRRGRTNRELSRDGDGPDADDREDRRDRRDDRDDRGEDRREKPRRRRDDDEDDRPRSKRRRDEPDDDADDDEDRDDRRDDDDDADASNRDDGEDGEDEDQDDDEDADDGDDDDDRNERDEPLFEVKVDGQRFKVTQSELVAGYQRGKDYQQKTQRLADTGRKFSAGHQHVAAEYSKRLQALGHHMGELKRALVGQIDSAQMEQLRVSDPAKYLLARDDIGNRIRKVDGLFAHLNQEHERQQKAFADEQAGHKQHLIAHEVELLSRHVPDWSEGKNGKPPSAVRTGQYLRKAGFADEEFMGVIDHRMLLIADKARRYDEMMARKNERGEPKRRPKPVPKRTPTGGSSTNTSRNSREDRQDRNQYTRARDQLRKSGDMRDAGAAIDALMSRDARRDQRRKRR